MKSPSLSHNTFYSSPKGDGRRIKTNDFLSTVARYRKRGGAVTRWKTPNGCSPAGEVWAFKGARGLYPYRFGKGKLLFARSTRDLHRPDERKGEGCD